MISRRILCGGGLLAAPAIVTAVNLMPLRGFTLAVPRWAWVRDRRGTVYWERLGADNTCFFPRMARGATMVACGVDLEPGDLLPREIPLLPGDTLRLTWHDLYHQ